MPWGLAATVVTCLIGMSVPATGTPLLGVTFGGGGFDSVLYDIDPVTGGASNPRSTGSVAEEFRQRYGKYPDQESGRQATAHSDAVCPAGEGGSSRTRECAA